MKHGDLDERLRRAVADKAPGVVLIVVGPEGIRARSAVGVADLATQARMAADVAIPWFSMTKLVTATTAMRLAERGHIELDRPIYPLVPALRLVKPDEWAKEITPRHLLQHGSGLANPMPINWIHPANVPAPDLTEFLSRLLRRHPRLRFRPGRESNYSNIGLLVLGSAIANVVGEPFDQVVRKELLDPIGMASTGFTFREGAPAATGYHPRWSPMRLLKS